MRNGGDYHAHPLDPPPSPSSPSMCATFCLGVWWVWVCFLVGDWLPSRERPRGLGGGGEMERRGSPWNSSFPPTTPFLHSNTGGGLMSVGCSDSSVQPYESKDKRGGGQFGEWLQSGSDQGGLPWTSAPLPPTKAASFPFSFKST